MNETENTGWTLGGEVQEQHEKMQERLAKKKRKPKPIYRMPTQR